MANIDVQTFCLGMWQTNSFVISTEGKDTCWIIDAGFEPERMIDWIKQKSFKPAMLFYTHAHLDHIAGTSEIKKAFPGVKTAVSEAEAAFLEDPSKNLSASAGMKITADAADIVLSDGQVFDFEGFEFTVISTPGHSPGGICLYQPESAVLFAGDTLFQGSIGRYDFPTSNGKHLFESIEKKLLILPDETKVFCGHGGSTTIGAEKASNPFLNR